MFSRKWCVTRSLHSASLGARHLPASRRAGERAHAWPDWTSEAAHTTGPIRATVRRTAERSASGHPSARGPSRAGAGASTRAHHRMRLMRSPLRILCAPCRWWPRCRIARPFWCTYVTHSSAWVGPAL
eukprot:3589753-Prymnesium_polylepis.1